MVAGNPRVTVVIPTYNWSAALRYSISSVLAQTFSDFELLAVGDACTDDSGCIAQSFGDPRIQWHNLTERIGSQSGPNNYALSIARGDYVAYLGHDDVWHPGHLASLLETMERREADVGCAVSVMYGPPGSGVRGLSGLFVEGEYRKDDFFPPSAMMHLRSLIGRIGGWLAPESISAPVDCEFLQRAHASGARIVSSGKLTVFKFNAAWRRDSYRRRDIGEQQSMLERLKTDAAGCVEAKLVDILQSAREGKMIQIQMPLDPSTPPGSYFRSYSRFRGLTAEALSPLTQTKRFPPDNRFSGLEWHELEHSEEYGPMRWSGPSPASEVVLPITTPPRSVIRIRLLNWFNTRLGEEVRVVINDELATIKVEESAPQAATISAIVSGKDESNEPLRIRLEVAKMRCPYFLSNGQSQDRRWLGVCLNWVEVEPLEQEA